MLLPSTNWTLIAEATIGGGESEKKALEEFCKSYWEPVAILIRTRGAPEERVEDLTQDFFLSIIKGEFLTHALRQNGKFRHFLLTSLRNFLTDDTRRTLALKRGGDLQKVELMEDTIIGEDDQLQFDLAWAEHLFHAAIEKTGEEVKARRGEKGWQILKTILNGTKEQGSYQDLGRELRLTEGNAKSEVFRMRKSFREHLRREIAKTVSAPHEIDEELRYLRDLILHKARN